MLCNFTDKQIKNLLVLFPKNDQKWWFGAYHAPCMEGISALANTFSSKLITPSSTEELNENTNLSICLSRNLFTTFTVIETSATFISLF